MKVKDLLEMPIRGGDLTKMADKWAKNLETTVLLNPKDYKVIGHIDELVVKNNLLTVTVWDGTKMVMAARVDPVPNAYCVVDDVWVLPEARGKKLFSKFLLFLKIDQGHTKIALADVHSDDTYNLLKSNGLKAFKKRWVNSNDDVKDFSPETIDDFYKAGKWKLILENSSDLSGYLREDSFTHTYDALANAVGIHEEL